MAGADDDLAAWVRLMQTPRVGALTARQLLSSFGAPQQIFEAGSAALARVAGEAVANALLLPPDAATRDLIARTLDWAAEPGHACLRLGDSGYPQSLLNIADPPPLLYALGDAALLNTPRRLAIVGARNPSAQGERDAHAFARAFSAAGVTVVSGFALGIDAAAHRGALASTGAGSGSTIAVLGTGCDRVYPARHRDLAHAVAGQGLLLSEFALGTPPARGNFPRRNRIISGLSSGVLVVEAATHSGSLITARLAAEQGREVFAIPGSIHNPMSRGCHRLLRDGAKLVECVDDVLSELQGAAPQGRPEPSEADAASVATHADLDAAAPAARELLAALGYAILSFDELAARTGRSAQWLGEHLIELELQGRVARLPGARYQRIERA